MSIALPELGFDSEDPHGFTTTCNLSTRVCDVLLYPLWAHIYIYIEKNIKFFFNIEKNIKFILHINLPTIIHCIHTHIGMTQHTYLYTYTKRAIHLLPYTHIDNTLEYHFTSVDSSGSEVDIGEIDLMSVI